jgi:hypothetical protein
MLLSLPPDALARMTMLARLDGGAMRDAQHQGGESGLTGHELDAGGLPDGQAACGEDLPCR